MYAKRVTLLRNEAQVIRHNKRYHRVRCYANTAKNQHMPEAPLYSTVYVLVCRKTTVEPQGTFFSNHLLEAVKHALIR